MDTPNTQIYDRTLSMEKSRPHNDTDFTNILGQCNADIVICYYVIVTTALELNLFTLAIFFLKKSN